jgi:hypothetical protein
MARLDLRPLQKMIPKLGLSVGCCSWDRSESFNSTPLGHETVAGAGKGV